MFFAGEGARATFEILRSVVFAAGAFPGNQLANRRSAGAGGWLFVRLHFSTRGFLSHRANTEPDFLFILVHFDDLKVVFLAWLQMNRLAVGIDGFGIVAETLNSVGQFDKRAEAGKAHHFAMQNVAVMMLVKIRPPEIRLNMA